MKHGVRSLAALAAFMLAFATGGAFAQDTIKLRFGKLTPSLAYARVTMAEQLGLFKKHGLDVEVTEFRAAPELNTAVLSGAIDIAHSGIAPVLTARERNLPVKAFFVETSSPFYHLLAASDIASLQDAVNKGAATAVSGIGSSDYAVTRYLFKRAGLDPDKLKYVAAGNPGQRAAALEAGRVQIALSGIPEVYEVLRRGKVKEVASMAEYTKEFTLVALWGREDYLANNPEAVKRFLAALDDAAQWIHTSPDAPAAIAKFLGLKGPEAIEDTKRALAETTFVRVAEHKAKLNELLAGCEPLAADAMEHSSTLKADSPAALVRQIFDTRYVR